MESLLKWAPGLRQQPSRRLAVGLLLALSAVAARLAARLHVAEKVSVSVREFSVLELDGRPGGALYEDGRLVAWLPGVDRL